MANNAGFVQWTMDHGVSRWKTLFQRLRKLDYDNINLIFTPEGMEIHAVGTAFACDVFFQHQELFRDYKCTQPEFILGVTTAAICSIMNAFDEDTLHMLHRPSFSPDKIVFQSGTATLTLQLLDLEYAKLEIPQQDRFNRATLDMNRLQRAIKSMMDLTDKNDSLRISMEVGGSVMRLSFEGSMISMDNTLPFLMEKEDEEEEEEDPASSFMDPPSGQKKRKRDANPVKKKKKRRLNEVVHTSDEQQYSLKYVSGMVGPMVDGHVLVPQTILTQDVDSWVLHVKHPIGSIDNASHITFHLAPRIIDD